MRYTLIFPALFALLMLGSDVFLGAAERSPSEVRLDAHAAQKAGNFKDAYDSFQSLAVDANDDAGEVSGDFESALECLQRLGRDDEIDDFREKVIAAHLENPQLLWSAAKSLTNGQYYGTIVAGKFYRGFRRARDGRQVSSLERDRVRAMQLMVSAVGKFAVEDKLPHGQFWLSFANMVLDRRMGNGAWSLQNLTDLSKLPDYDEQRYYGGSIGAPVNEDGSPVFHQLPKSWDDATTDGQRWRWCLDRAAAASPATAEEANYTFAEFLLGQFGVETMANSGYGRLMGASADDEKKNESGPYAVRSLGEDETIARLAVGIRRFKLPEEFNYIHLLQKLSTSKSNWGDNALLALAGIFENRQQYDRAAEYWKTDIAQFDPGNNNYKQNKLDQIIGNWATFDPIETEPAGQNAGALMVYRNGKKISFEATDIDVSKLLDDVKAYLNSNPAQLDWQTINIADIGYRLVTKDVNKYLGKETNKWDMDLDPRPNHLDRRVKVEIPIKKAGAYLLTARMDAGNTTQIVVWIADTVIVKKTLEKGAYFFLADAVTGQPIPKAKLDFFGYEQKWLGNNKYQVNTKTFSDTTDDEGQAMTSNEQQANNYQWVTTATSEDGRFAYIGFTGIWGGGQYDSQYNQTKQYIITDRPVYRPGQTVKYKIWIEQTKYDQQGNSPFANQLFTVTVRDGRNEKVVEKSLMSDDFGGISGELELAEDAMLGEYSIGIDKYGSSGFRVEEYKKPEYEVKIDAPTEPVMLGEKITATIEAKYYFGAPVVSAKVKYKILRTTYSADWFPVGRWDWFYEPGYWWFGQDYNWYPGFASWGMRRPMPWWIGRGFQRPEVVAENEVPIGADGTVKVEIDTAPALALLGDNDHKYSITAEVTDESRRTIVGTGDVLVARKPFKVYVWANRGFYQTGDAIEAEFRRQTLANKPVKGTGEVKLFKITYDKDKKPVETEVNKWPLDTNEIGHANLQMTAADAGQYRISYTVKDDKGHSIEGGYVVVIRGQGFTGKDFRFNNVELVPDKKEYQPGDAVHLMVNTDQADSTVLLFVRPANGIYLPPKVLHLKGKSTVEDITVAVKDMPNFFVEAVSVGQGKVYQETRDMVVPPASRVINVEVLPSAQKYKPGEKATVNFKLTDDAGKPIAGSTALSIYDKAVEYISGGSNVPEIKAFFWKWRRSHYPRTESSLDRISQIVGPPGRISMQYLGIFGQMVANLGVEHGEPSTMPSSGEADASDFEGADRNEFGAGGGGGGIFASRAQLARDIPAAPMAAGAMDGVMKADKEQAGAGGAEPPLVDATVRKNFADTALWVGSLVTKADGIGQVQLTMPETLTTWKTRVWAIGDGTRVGEGTAEVVTFKNLIVRLQAPRFFVEKDEVVLSANIHNYLKTAKSVKAKLDLAGDCLTATDAVEQTVQIEPDSEKRVDWHVKVVRAGQATVKVSALTDEESDAMEMSFPSYIHGMLKTDSFSGAMRPADKDGSLTITVPDQRIIADSRLEIRYSPSVALALVDALPYLVDYPYDSTDQTINRFLPTVITQKILLDMHLDLKAIRDKRTNLNAQEIGNDQKRAADWVRNNPPNPGASARNPVFDQDVVNAMAREGMTKLANMQLSDGGWGWFSGFGETSLPHTTALVVHGLQVAKANDVPLIPGILDRGVQWLKNYQAEQISLLKNFATKTNPSKEHADNLDAFVYMVLGDSAIQDKDMMEFLYRDRNELAVYGKSMFGLALSHQGEKEKLAMILDNCSQYVVQDDEDQTAHLKLPENNPWWCWYGSETESMGYYLKLLAKADPKSPVAPKLAKYLITNRKHASYWDSTRDTAICIEALADYVKATGEDAPEMSVDILIDDKKMKEVDISAANLFSFDNKLVLSGADITSGKHTIKFLKSGKGPLYYNAYLTNFTLEDPIAKAGLEIKVQRKIYKLVPVDQKIKSEGMRGQSIDQKVEKYDRQLLPDGAILKSGDLVEVELEIDSKNDYEYVMFEDMKASGFEPVDLRSGYNGNDLNAYMELRDERVCFFARLLARGKHSVAYRVRAEIPGQFSVLPTKASAVYAPELKGNSDENKVGITD